MLGEPNQLSLESHSPYLVTGAAGFIGAAVCSTLLGKGRPVVGIDNFDPFYDPALKHSRVARLSAKPGFRLVEADIGDFDRLVEVFRTYKPGIVLHLAAQPGIAYSTSKPLAYVRANLVGTMNVLEACRLHEVEHLAYASSSSVYGANSQMPLTVGDPAESPVSVYAATKRSNELMAHSYSHLFGLPTTGMRFFTVYGPWGRPDMAYFKFADKMLARQPITIYGDGLQRRDFTYIDDIATAVAELADLPPKPRYDAGIDSPEGPPFRLLNIGRGEPVTLNRLIAALEHSLGVTAIARHEPPRAADMTATQADVEQLRQQIGFSPRVSIEEGVALFADWFRNYRRLDRPPYAAAR